MENSTGEIVKTLKTNKGGKFTSKAFEAHFKAYGIKHKLIIPKTPEQNGAAERLNKMLVETTRAILLDAGLLPSFWTEVLLEE